MCQIIIIRDENPKMISYLIKNKEKIKNSLNFKGGEGYSFFFVNINTKEWFNIEAQKFEDGFRESIEKLIKWNDKYVAGILFSRQRPEMENENVDLPPYWNEDQTKFVWMHGTISNVSK